METNCSCGRPLYVNQNGKGCFCPKCDRAPVTPADDMNELGYSLEAYAKDMSKALKEWGKFFRKPCQGGCGKSFPLNSLRGGKWCTECYDLKNETN